MKIFMAGNKKKKRSTRKPCNRQLYADSSMKHGCKSCMDVRRDLIDIGIKEIYELQGRSAESLMEEIKDLRPDTPDYRLAYLQMGIYFAENDPPEPSKLHPSFWENS